MSAEELALDVLHGNFSHAWQRWQDFYSGLPAPIRRVVGLLGTDEGKILQSLVDLAVKDVAANGFTTASFVTAGKDVLASLIAKNISTFTIQHVMAVVNLTAAPLVPVAAPPVAEPVIAPVVEPVAETPDPAPEPAAS